MIAGTRGVATLGRILARLADGGQMTVAALAAAEGLPRSSVFEIVRKLDRAGLVGRLRGGALAPGPEAVRFGFAAFGIGPLHGPAEALLALLRDETDGTAALCCGEVDVLRFAARWDLEGTSASLEGTVADAAGVERARLKLSLRPNATKGQRGEAQVVFERVRLSLEHYLAENFN